MRSGKLLWIGALAGALFVGPVWAQSQARWDNATPKQTGQANTAYQAGSKHLGAKRYDEALAKFRESYGIVANPSTRWMIVRTLNEAGRPVEAYREGVEALQEAEEAAKQQPDTHKTALEGIQSELQAAKAKIALLTVTVSGAPEGATVTLGGNPLPASEWGKPVALEPGAVDVALQSAAGNDSEKVSLQPGGEATVTLSPPPAPKPAAPPPPPPAPPKEEEGGYRGPDRLMLAMIAGGVGVVGFIGFGTFGLLANARFDRLERACDDDDFCDPDLEDQADKGRTYQTVANVGLGVGLVGIAAGVGLFLWDTFEPDAEPRSWRIGVGPTGAGVQASF